MSIRPIDSPRHRSTFLLIATLILAVFSAVGSLAVPVDDPVADREAILEHRRAEAASKNILTKGLLALVFIVPLMLILGVVFLAVIPVGAIILLLPVIVLGGLTVKMVAF